MFVDRLPPQDIQTEESVLASCLLDHTALQTVLDVLTPEDFYKSAHEKIFKTMQYLVRHKKPVDLTTVASCLLEFNKLSEIGGASFLSNLIDACPMATNIEAYAETVKAKSILRQLIQVQSKNIDLCYSTASEDIPEMLDNVQKSILSIQTNGHKDNFSTMSDITIQSIDRYEELSHKKIDRAIKTGFPTIDSLTGGGFRGSKFIVIAARPRMGKTALMLNMAKEMAQNGRKVGIFSIEMDKEDLDDRLMSSETGINCLKLNSGRDLSSDDWLMIMEAASVKSEWPIFIDDDGGLNILELKRRARRMKKQGAEIIFIDQLSKIKAAIKGSAYEQKTNIVNEIADLKKELRIPVVLLAQINRKLEDRNNKKPTLGDIKDTGSVEEDADIIIFIHRNYEYSKKEEEKYEATIEIAKQRMGPVRSKIPMNWMPKTTTFTEKHETD